MSSRFVPAQGDRAVSELCFSKVVLAFIAFIINCTIEMECTFLEIAVVVAAAEKYLGM